MRFQLDFQQQSRKGRDPEKHLHDPSRRFLNDTQGPINLRFLLAQKYSMGLEEIMLSEISQAEKVNYHMVSLICGT